MTEAQKRGDGVNQTKCCPDCGACVENVQEETLPGVTISRLSFTRLAGYCGVCNCWVEWPVDGPRFFVFAGGTYYPAGGTGDYRGAYDTLEQARDRVRELSTPGLGEYCDWTEIATIKGGELVDADD